MCLIEMFHCSTNKEQNRPLLIVQQVECLPGVVVPAVGFPVLYHDLLNTLLSGSKNGEPCKHSPKTILFTDMVGTWRGAEQPQIRSNRIFMAFL